MQGFLDAAPFAFRDDHDWLRILSCDEQRGAAGLYRVQVMGQVLPELRCADMGHIGLHLYEKACTATRQPTTKKAAGLPRRPFPYYSRLHPEEREAPSGHQPSAVAPSRFDMSSPVT